MTERNGAVDSGDATLAAAMTDLDETLVLHGSLVAQAAELTSLVGERLDARGKSLERLIERAERCTARMEGLPLPPAWRWALTGMAWAVVGGLTAGTVTGVANLVLRELAR